MTRKPRAKRKATVDNSDELVSWLIARRVRFCRTTDRGSVRKDALNRGVPGFLIFGPTSKRPDARGLAILLKTQERIRLSPSEESWLEFLCELGWVATLACDVDEAINTVRNMGYVSEQ